MVATPYISFFLSFIAAIFLIPAVKRLSLRFGKVAQPRDDRWHTSPTPVLGGIGIFVAFTFGLLVTGLVAIKEVGPLLEILIISFLIFLLGLYDDFKPLAPPAKFVGQILIATLAVSLGYTTDFFTPRIDNAVLAQLPNIILTYFWLVGITNAINLLDNMDGLAGGICFITAAILSFFFWQAGDQFLLVVSLSIAGSCLAFLIFNFPPASIFMGDSGSLFLGFSLALLAITRQPQASNVLAVMGVPTLLFLLPILDTVMVTITRILRGQSPVKGGRDHTSHRLIAFGFTERQAVLVLYFVALISGMTAIVLESIQYWFSLVLVPLIVISLALLVAYLGGLKIMDTSPGLKEKQAITRIMVDLTFRRRLLEVLLDFFLIGFAYYLSIFTYYRFEMSENQLGLFLNSLPYVLGVVFLIFYSLGVYRGMWRYMDINDLARYAVASVVSSVSVLIIIFLIGLFGWGSWARHFPSSVLFLFSGFLIISLSSSRASFWILDMLHDRRTSKDEARVLIVGPGDSVEMALRWLQMNPHLHYKPIAIIDDDPMAKNRQIHGVPVIGEINQTEYFIHHLGIKGIILSGFSMSDEDIRHLRLICQEHDCWLQSLRLELEGL